MNPGSWKVWSLVSPDNFLQCCFTCRCGFVLYISALGLQRLTPRSSHLRWVERTPILQSVKRELCLNTISLHRALCHFTFSKLQQPPHLRNRRKGKLRRVRDAACPARLHPPSSAHGIPCRCTIRSWRTPAACRLRTRRRSWVQTRRDARIGRIINSGDCFFLL